MNIKLRAMIELLKASGQINFLLEPRNFRLGNVKQGMFIGIQMNRQESMDLIEDHMNSTVKQISYMNGQFYLIVED